MLGDERWGMPGLRVMDSWNIQLTSILCTLISDRSFTDCSLELLQCQGVWGAAWVVSTQGNKARWLDQLRFPPTWHFLPGQTQSENVRSPVWNFNSQIRSSCMVQMSFSKLKSSGSPYTCLLFMLVKMCEEDTEIVVLQSLVHNKIKYFEVFLYLFHFTASNYTRMPP